MSEFVETSESPQSTRQELKRHVLNIIAEVLQIQSDPQAGDILRRDVEAWDSVSHLRLALDMEDAFQIALSDDAWANVNSVDEIVALLAAQGVSSIQKSS